MNEKKKKGRVKVRNLPRQEKELGGRQAANIKGGGGAGGGVIGDKSDQHDRPGR